MENIDLSKIPIIESEFYNMNAPYVKFFRRHNIKTIDQLVYGKFEKCSFGGHLMSPSNASILRAFIRLLKNKYLGEPLVVDVYLDRVIDISQTEFLGNRGGIRFTKYKDEEVDCDLHMFFGGDIGDKAFSTFISSKKMENAHRFVDNMPKKEVRMIDFFNWIFMDGKKYLNLIPFAKVYVAAYKENEGDLKADSVTIDFLYSKLSSLKKEKDALDKEIEKVENAIAAYSTEKGGSKR